MVLFRVWFICLLVGGVIFANWFVCWLGGVMFANWFVSLLVGGYVCYWVCLFVGWWLCDSIISLTLGMVSVLDFFITNLNQSHGF